MTDTDVTESEVEIARSRRGTWLALGGIVVAATLLALVFSSRFGQDPRLVDSPLIGRPLPDLTLEYMEQEGSLTFSDLEGQIVVINVWASWCVPCRIEHPALVAASKTYAERGVRFVGLLYQDRVGPASEFLDELGRGEGYLYVVDTDSRATVELGVFGVPETYFVDADGMVRGKVQGEVNPMVLVQTIEDLLAGREPEL
ncbi:MAG: redoxin family protein [Acidimicrobiia bacterium]|nr:redoxin family protein [Acidimicrobiia bacterium]